ncbi:hypothetical protein C7I55_08295 [Sphingomonas deserti]|uniref:Uncharacterized protein n=1 Tax=Allosphingosinicella deserti TaxID=2116704 RepID=A0A2P7QW79_9SPHN|nr:hypothetical protein C7I55_08295 [Sphingomonas deserti]
MPLDGDSLLGRFSTAELIGEPGYSMRVVVNRTEFAELCRALSANFVVEPDHTLQTFETRKARLKRPGRRRTLRIVRKPSSASASA